MTRSPSKHVPAKKGLSSLTRRALFALLAVVYAIAAIVSASKVISGTEDSTKAIENVLLTYNLKNEGAEALYRYSKEHPIIGMFAKGPVNAEMKLPSKQQADEAIYGDIPHLIKAVRHESSSAAWWSWFLLSVSLLYVVIVVASERSFTTRPVLFALTACSVNFFLIGIIAPAMVIWTAPSIPLASGNLNFVLQHEVRGIAAIIWDLLTNGHWIIGGFLLLFSIVTPLTKASLTFFVSGSRSHRVNYRIGQVLHTIGKWSMADVFVAAVLLALYALKFQEATKSIPCLGLYYFIGYCLLSMTTTELLVHSEAVNVRDKKESEKELGRGAIAVLFAILVAYVAGSAVYTFQQYTLNTREKVPTLDAPRKLDNSDLVLPVHHP
jgi:hypothetical protein